MKIDVTVSCNEQFRHAPMTVETRVVMIVVMIVVHKKIEIM